MPATKPLTYFRSAALRGDAQTELRVDRATRTIFGVAVCTRGEALGHGMWIDTEFLQSLVDSQALNDAGLKSRFTHPGLCADGTGKYLGRLHDLRLDGDVVRADFKLSAAASKSPDGDLAEYVMTMAEEDPAAFGLSIVSLHDVAAMRAHWVENGGEIGRCPYTGERTYEGDFESPDPLNEKKLPHARLARLAACDVVDEPAANPAGFFSRGEDLAARGTVAINYLLGRSEHADPETFGMLDPARVRTFFNQCLANHGLAIVERDAMSKPKTKAGKKATLSKKEAAEADDDEDDVEAAAEEDDTEETSEAESDEDEETSAEADDEDDDETSAEDEDDEDDDETSAELARLRALRSNPTLKAHPDAILSAFDRGLTAEKAEVEFLRDENKRLKAGNKGSSAPSKKRGAQPATFNTPQTGSAGSFRDQAKALAKAEGISYSAAASRLAKENPELFEASKGQ